MSMIIPIESVVANAFIELRKKDKEADELTFSQVDAYGRQIMKFFDEAGDIAIIPRSRTNYAEFFDEYSDMFVRRVGNKESYITLKNDDASVDKKLIDFNAYLSLEVLSAFSKCRIEAAA